MKTLYSEIAEAACCAGCPTNVDGDCMYRQQNCERLETAKTAVSQAPIWGNYLVAPHHLHIHFYVNDKKACKKLQAEARRRLENRLREDCSLCESVLEAVNIPVRRQP